MDELMAICAGYNVPLIEDAAESLGAAYKGQDTGTFGRMGIFSFNGNKIITTSGGGMLVSDEKDLIDKARFLSTQARDPARHYQHSQIGFNYRMSNIVAGIGRGQLIYLGEHMLAKQKIYQQYKQAFADFPFTMNPLNRDGEANNWLSCITINDDCQTNPDQIMDALEAENIECRPIWKPMHMQPVFQDYVYFTHDDGIDVSADIFARGLCLPSDIKNTPDDMEMIIDIIKSTLL
jgi:dTDP-4-amino-4,6-dideoxygalactose transaminase